MRILRQLATAALLVTSAAACVSDEGEGVPNETARNHFQEDVAAGKIQIQRK